MKLLLIEDEAELQDSVAEYLREEGFVCETASNFKESVYKLGVYDYDLVILDVTLPDGNGLELLDQLKIDHPKMGVLILSARNSLDDRLKGLDLGADDYLTKPFHFAELNSRVNAIIRRRSFQGQKKIRFEEIEIDPSAKEAQVNDQLLDLTRKEYDLLLYLITNKDRLLTKEAIAEHLWGDSMDLADNFDFIYSHIKNLRKKVREAGGNDYLQSVYGMGYKFTSR
jgi:DNA-binding response OmpR family regulator